MDGQQNNCRVYERAVKAAMLRRSYRRPWNPMTCYILQEMSMNDVIYEQVNIIKQERKTGGRDRSLLFWKAQVSRSEESMVSGKGPSLWTRRGREGCLRWRLSLYLHPFIGVKRVSW